MFFPKVNISLYEFVVIIEKSKRHVDYGNAYVPRAFLEFRVQQEGRAGRTHRPQPAP